MNSTPGVGQYVTCILIGAVIGGVPGFVAGAFLGAMIARGDPFNLFV